MIPVPPGVRVLVWSTPVDFRAGMDRLAALVQVTLRLDPFAGDVFVFRSRRPDHVTLCIPSFKVQAVSSPHPVDNQRSSWGVLLQSPARLS
jgi:IS66 Orf2 like protein